MSGQRVFDLCADGDEVQQEGGARAERVEDSGRFYGCGSCDYRELHTVLDYGCVVIISTAFCPLYLYKSLTVDPILLASVTVVILGHSGLGLHLLLGKVMQLSIIGLLSCSFYLLCIICVH